MVDVLVTRPLLKSAMERLDRTFTVHKLYEADDQDAFLSAVGTKIRGVATNGNIGCPPEVLNRTPNLEIVSSFGVGYDGIDVEACRSRGIRVTNTPDVLNDAMAELTLGLMLAVCREIPQAHNYVLQGKWPSGPYHLTRELTGKTLGILGLGRIGKEVARRAQAFKMQVIYHGRNEQPHEPYTYYGDLADMAAASDWLVCIVPGGPATDGMVNTAVLDALGPEGVFINVGRGSTVDEAALIAALKEGRLGAAGLDVFADEPNVPEALKAMPNVVLSPHQGSATHKTRFMMGDLVVENLVAHFDGRPVLTPVA
ncbi:2-hydroxyacid dehydrogenase [Acuticoccus mangrovi]|uniref:2-hydroxyacid dehydrogenase n=1 Tax=Acuticoccus mangrovi TaxID=2796142 RepID=A0A934ITK9_9HYPH|nr:2-hydroxyacid dehydrogenase [Acuticoccus mangrovi]MBJ3778581.1 2-hydroxyacid dehydrogenase [Acuticoccus mangrovi]